MKKFFTTLTSTLFVICLSAQNKEVEAEIRKLEQMEVKAVLEKDSATLLILWDSDYVVNAPDNTINFGGKTTLDRPVLQRPRIAFTREVEQVIIRDGVVFSMGNETVVPGGDQVNAGQTIKRRYTNIWMRKDNRWKLIARHANVICR